LEKEVIIDDFGPGGIDINHLLRWFDRYKCMVETKGGMIPLIADKFILPLWGGLYSTKSSRQAGRMG